MSDVNSKPPTKPSTPELLILILGIGAVFAIALGLVLTPLLLDGRSSGAPASASSATAPPYPSTTPTPSTATSNKLDARLNVRVLLGFQSIGADISQGIQAAFRGSDLPKPKVLSWSRAKKERGALVATAKIGRNGSPKSKMKAFAALVNEAPRNSIDVAVLMFNYQDITAESNVDDVFQSYTDTMTSLENANPQVDFLYATTPVTTANSWTSMDSVKVTGLTNVTQPLWQDNIARERFNGLMRARYQSTGQLFDIAALEADLGKGKVVAKEHEKQWYHVMNPALSIDGRRLNKTGSVKLATALMVNVAHIAAAR